MKEKESGKPNGTSVTVEMVRPCVCHQMLRELNMGKKWHNNLKRNK